MHRIWLVALIAALLAAGPTTAFAQLPDPPRGPSEDDVSQAREAFVRGMELAGERRFAQARREFVHSYSLSGSPVALFNLASTLQSLELPRDAAVAFERLLADPGLDATIRGRAEPMLAEVALAVARVRLHGELAGATLRLDGGPPRLLLRSPTVVVVDPGAHRLDAERAGAEPWHWDGRLSRGAALDLAVELAAARAPEPGGGVDPGVVVGIGVAAGVLIGVLVGSLVLDAEAQLAPRTPWVIVLP